MSTREIIMSAAGMGVPNYWIGTIDSNTWLFGADIDGTGNLYAAGADYTSLSKGLGLKVAQDGIVTWQRTLSNSSYDIEFHSVSVDSSDNAHFFAKEHYFYLETVKYNSSGTLQWQKALDPLTQNAYAAGDANSSGYVFVGCLSGEIGVGPYASYVAAYNTSGTLQWQQELSDAVQVNGIATQIVSDGSGNIYLTGNCTVSSQDRIVIAKYNSSGAIQWQRTFAKADGTTPLSRGRVAYNGSDIIVTAYDASGSGLTYVAKYTTSGTLSWQRKIAGVCPASVCADSLGNVYVLGFDAAASISTALIFKYNSSGTLQWQRELAETSGSPASVYVEDGDAKGPVLFIVGAVSGTSYGGFAASLPADGSLTGSYSVGGYSFSYSTPSYTESAGDASDASASLTDSAGAATTSTPTDTDAAGSLTLTKVDL